MSAPANDRHAAPLRKAAQRREDDKPQGRNALLRYGATLGVIALVLGGALYLFLRGDDMPPPRQVRELTIVNIIPPPPPPPPPQQMPEPKMIEQPKMVEPEIQKPEKPVEEPKNEPPKEANNNDQPPGPLSLDAKPTGPGDLFNLGSKPGGGRYGPGGGGSRWGWYASIVQAQIETALRANPRTRNAVLQVQIRLWADSTGHVSRVQLVSSTGDAELDAIIRNEVLGNLVLREPPPRDMPMPMVTRVTARRPS